MKSGKTLKKVIDTLQTKGLMENSSMVERCGMDGEKVYVNLSDVNPGSSYFSTIVVKDKEK